MAAVARVLHSSSLVKLSDFTCDAPRSGRGRERCNDLASVTIIRRGVHAYHARGRDALAEPGMALLYRSGETYALSHPHDRSVPDRSTCVEFDRALLEEVFGARELARDLGAPVSPATQLLSFQLTSALSTHGGDRLSAEESVMDLLRRVAVDFERPRDDLAMAATARRRVERARAFIAARPEADHGLEAVAAAAACSPFHLTRLFKRQTGMTIRSYRLRLRLALALQEIADGAPDLAGVAVRSGFADHSHMTASFRKLFGSAPSALREQLGSRRLAQQSKLLQAAARRTT